MLQSMSIYQYQYIKKKSHLYLEGWKTRDGKTVAQWLRALAALTETLDLVLSTGVAVALQLSQKPQFQGLVPSSG